MNGGRSATERVRHTGGMALTVTPQSIFEYEMEHASDGQAAIAAQLTAWAEDATVEHDDGSDPTYLLITAAEHLGFAGDFEGKLALLDRAEQADGESHADIDAYRVHALFALGRDDEATALADQIRKRRSRNPFTCDVLADVFLDRGDAKQALRWTNIGLRLLEDAMPDDATDTLLDLMIVRRYGIRREMQMPMDAYDEEAEELLAEQAEVDEKGDDG